jgi:DNA-binding NarL/FixJ family response regulator
MLQILTLVTRFGSSEEFVQFEEPMKPLSILIADDHALIRRAMRTLLESQPNWQVCGEGQNGREALEEASRLKPDLAVLDITMPELNGLEAIARIRKEVPHSSPCAHHA